MILSRPAILRHMEKGTVIIDEFKEENLGSAQYDVTLGEHYYLEEGSGRWNFRARDGGLYQVYDPFHEEDVRSVWRPAVAERHTFLAERQGWESLLPNIGPDEKVILLMPGETILAHTQEFIGGRDCITTQMKARSSTGRNMISVCKCAGQGDIGYYTRWTMEITNHSMRHVLPLVAGRRVAQMVFFETEPLAGADYTGDGGKYQTGIDLADLKKRWSPEEMLPKQWRDREVRALNHKHV